MSEEKDKLFEKGQLLVQQANEIKELRTRVAELEGELKYTEGIRSRTTEDIAKHNEELQTRLSTLLKASEGMEKALEEAYLHNQNMHCYATGGKLNLELNLQTVGLREALADFRAVKEGK